MINQRDIAAGAVGDLLKATPCFVEQAWDADILPEEGKTHRYMPRYVKYMRHFTDMRPIVYENFFPVRFYLSVSEAKYFSAGIAEEKAPNEVHEDGRARQ
jgi:hypothetical protein